VTIQWAIYFGLQSYAVLNIFNHHKV